MNPRFILISGAFPLKNEKLFCHCQVGFEVTLDVAWVLLVPFYLGGALCVSSINIQQIKMPGSSFEGGHFSFNFSSAKFIFFLSFKSLVFAIAHI